ncbi:DUF2766 family protein, partial [Escherichia coli]
ATHIQPCIKRVHPAAADPVTMRAIQKAIALIELKFTPQGESH